MIAFPKQNRYFSKPSLTAILSTAAFLLSAQNFAMAQSTPLRPPTPLAPPQQPAAPVTAAKPSGAMVAANTTTSGLNTGVVALKFVPNIATMAKIRALPADAIIETSSGRKVLARNFVATMDGLKGLGAKQAKLKRMDFKFSKPTSAATVRVNANNFSTLRAMPNNAVLELPNGLKLTNGEMKQLETLEARTNIAQLMGANVSLATSLANNPGAKYAGMPAIKLKTPADIAQLKGKPDSTIVEAPDGTRSTLGELKAALAAKFAVR